MIKVLHADGTLLPYWACFAAISIMVRTALIPVVIYGAHTASRFAKVVPEVQFILTLHQNDLTKLREKNASLAEKFVLFRTNFFTLSGIYKLHSIHPFSVFLSPLLQLPIFLYISRDLRKIVNGLDPYLAQDLVDSSCSVFPWISDLTELDPWFALPVMAGIVLYANLEVAIGSRNLAGPAASKANTAVFMKDLFQSVAVFMPCFTCQLPSGVQIYVLTSFLFTVVQSTALRTDSFRSMVGLPSLLAPPPEAKYAQQFIELKRLEQKARELRGNGPVLGKNGILAPGWEVSFAGSHRKSTIEGSGITPTTEEVVGSSNGLSQRSLPTYITRFGDMPFVHGVSAPPWQLEEQEKERIALEEEQEIQRQKQRQKEEEQNYMHQTTDDVMEKANRGDRPVPTRFVETDEAVSKAPVKLKEKGLTSRKKEKGKKLGSKRRRKK
jgi:membrane protein insertase Oxa1/YidC/SpoIIIJ